MGILLKNVRLLRDPAPATLHIQRDRIVAVTRDSVCPGPDDEIVDARGKLAIPGFVNAHTHLPMVLLRGIADGVPLREWLERYVWPIERRLQPDDVYWGTLLALAESIRAGTVAVADMYFHADSIARAVEESGLRGILSYGMIAESMSKNGDRELAVTEALVDAWHGAADGRVSIAVGPHSPYTCGDDVWCAAAQLATDRGLLVHTHLSESRRETEEARARWGTTQARHLEQLGVFSVPTAAAHCAHVDEVDIEVLARHGVSVVHCPKSNAKLGNGVAPVAAMRARGVCVALGTDGAASNDRLDMIEELRAAWLVERAMSEDPGALRARDVVSMATDEGRRALRLPRAQLEVGDVADVVLIDLDRPHTTPSVDACSTLAFSSASSDVTDVFVAGRALLRDGRLLTIDEERVQSEVNRLLCKREN